MIQFAFLFNTYSQNMEMLKIAKDIRKYHAKSIVICDHKKRNL